MADDHGAVVVPVAGMTCEACAVSLQANLSAVSGVTRVAVDYESGKAVILPAGEGSVSRAALVEVIEGSGYRVETARP